MTFAECIYQIRQHIHASSNIETIRIARVSLTVLADCLPGTLTQELAEQLPYELASDLARPVWQTGERLSLSELVQLVASQEGVTKEEARDHITAVLDILRKTLDDNVLSQLLTWLPEDIGGLTEVVFPLPRMHQAVA